MGRQAGQSVRSCAARPRVALARLGTKARNEQDAPAVEPVETKGRNIKPLMVTAAVVVGALLGALPALALWSDSGSITAPSFNIGTVAFAAGPFNPTDVDEGAAPIYTTYQPTPAAPLQIHIPGDLIAQVASTTPVAQPAPPAAIYSFAVAGLGPEPVGVDYTVTAIGQYLPPSTDDDDKVIPGDWITVANPVGSIWTGVANAATELSRVMAQVYPAPMPDGETGYADAAALQTACLAVAADLPALPVAVPNANNQNVFVYYPNSPSNPATSPDLSSLALAPNAATPTPIVLSPLGNPPPGETPAAPAGETPAPPGEVIAGTLFQQYWCVALNPIGGVTAAEPTGLYSNQFSASALGCAAATLDPVTGTPTCTDWQVLNDASGGVVQPSDQSVWIKLVQGPEGEPDLVLQIDPTVVHISSVHTQTGADDVSYNIDSPTHPTAAQPNPYYLPN